MQVEENRIRASIICLLCSLPARRSTSFCNLAIVRSARSARCSAYWRMIQR